MAMGLRSAFEWLIGRLFFAALLAVVWSVWACSIVIKGVYYIFHPVEFVKMLRLRGGSPPKSLPRSRRSLSLSSEQPRASKKPPRTFTQLQSSFFKLPAELRQLVYREILASPVPIHVRRTHRRLCSMPCKGAHHSHGNCGQPLSEDGTVTRRLPGEAPRQDKRLPLLRSCRRVYTEAVELLYTANTLHFDDLQTIQCLPRCITPRRLSSIRFVTLDLLAFWDATVNPEILEAWKPACDVLAGMQDISELTITLHWRSKWSTDKAPLSTLLDPLKDIKTSKSFIVEVPPNGDPESIVDGTGDVPFTLVPDASLKIQRHDKCIWWGGQSKLFPRF
ncbi:uncharacterized protein BJX67DRAFT_77778 [Aspergillus lucknowensis]|uniref:DUF7730 domain-containing protein n=1 Tax=Aspergillus lucknowensis TaxID=176173 RepID=A0ABR4LTI1_9EURO